MMKIANRPPLFVLALMAVSAMAVAAQMVFSSPISETEAPPSMLARVNGDDIALAELRRVKADLIAARDARGQTDNDHLGVAKFEEQAVQSLIHRHLMLQEARRRAISVSGGELDAAISELRSRFSDLESFGIWMDERGLDDKLLFKAVGDDLLVQRVSAELAEGGPITDEQVESYFETHKNNIVIGQQVRLGIIVVSSIDEANAILRGLRDGINFHSLARSHSRGRLAANGGDTGWTELEALPPQIREVVSVLKEGEASNPVQKNDAEFLIVAVVGRRPVRATSLDEVTRAEIERRVLRAERQKNVVDWLRQQERESTIEVYYSPSTTGDDDVSI